MTWGEIKRLINAVIDDDARIASIDWEMHPRIRVSFVLAGIILSGSE
jgi:hypothetical protein